jgi:quercetin dioxygenase-like cupin family protein
MYIFHVNRFCMACKPPLHRSNKRSDFARLAPTEPRLASGVSGSPSSKIQFAKLWKNPHPYQNNDSPDTRDPDGREGSMLTRRGFAGFASCAICAVAGFAATDASAAEGAPLAVTSGITRKILSQMDGPMPGYVTIIVESEVEPGVTVARHTHPGIESGYLIEGSLDLPIAGQPTRTLKPGDGFQIPPETPHAGGKPGDKKTRITSTYVVEKGKPLATPAPA